MTALFAPTPKVLWGWGRALLMAGLIGGLLVILMIARTGNPTLALMLPITILAVVGITFLFARPTLNLFFVLVGFVIIADNEAGFQFREILYGLYLYGVLAHWYITRSLLRRERFLLTPEDKALFLFLILLPLTLVLTILFNGSLKGATSEFFSLSLLALYFPLKDVCVRHRHGPRILLLIVVGIGMLVAIRNVVNYQYMLSNVTQAWQVVTGRVVTNDNLLMVSSLVSLILLIFAHRRRTFVLLLGCFLLCFGGLLLTQSRGYWMAFLLGAGAMFFLVGPQLRKRMLGMGGLGLVLLLGFGFIFLGPYMDLLLGGLLERFSSIGSAATADISLINRFREARTVMEHIVLNPVLGHGMGVSYLFYDIAHQATDYDALVHNGYVGLWYKFGLWGLGLILFFWASCIRRGVQAFRMQQGTSWMRLCGLASALCLIAFTLSTVTSNPFFLKDSLFIFSVTAGLAGGAYQRSLREKAEAEK